MSRSPRIPLPREVFLSHATGNRRMAGRIDTTLRGHGVPVWFSQTNLLGAQQWHDEIGAALARCDWFAVLLSPQAAASMWVKRELLFALRSRQWRDRIIPLRYRACDSSLLSWTLDDFQMIDFSRAYQDGCRSLLRMWGLGLRENA